MTGVSTLVMGARPDPSENRYGSYNVEALLQLAGWQDGIQVVTGILPAECLEVLQEWEARNMGGR